jgi:hypothetical protein
MNLIAWVMRMLDWPAPAVRVPTRKRRPLAVCPVCHRWFAEGKDHQAWKHRCLTPDYGPAPGPMDPHDRIDELERTDD